MRGCRQREQQMCRPEQRGCWGHGTRGCNRRSQYGEVGWCHLLKGVVCQVETSKGFKQESDVVGFVVGFELEEVDWRQGNCYGVAVTEAETTVDRFRRHFGGRIAWTRGWIECME